MLEHLRLKLELPAEKFFVFLENCGNTVSSSIPIAIKEAMLVGRLRPGMTVMLVGFGVGLSWAATIVKW
jgi:3-oxoacyl-[acyl-carrier-protein] synthase-3